MSKSPVYRPGVRFTVRAAKQLQPHANLPSILRVPRQGKQANVFGSKGVMEDIPLHLIIIPVSRQSLKADEEGKKVTDAAAALTR